MPARFGPRSVLLGAAVIGVAWTMILFAASLLRYPVSVLPAARPAAYLASNSTDLSEDPAVLAGA